MKKPNKDVNYYLNLPWTYTIETEIQDENPLYIIHVNELPGICTDSENLEEGMKEIKTLIACAVGIYKEQGKPVPEPINRELYKGKILYRTNSERHYQIVKASKMMHKSISKTLDTIIDRGFNNLHAI